MSKKIKSKVKYKLNILKYVLLFSVLILLGLFSFVLGYYMGVENTKIALEKKKERRQELLKKIEETNISTVNNVNDRLKKILIADVKAKKESKKKEEVLKKIELKKEVRIVKEEELTQISNKLKKEILKIKEYTGASHEYTSTGTQEFPSRVKRKVKVMNSNKPKLAIIIDDVSVASHVRAIKSLGYNLTMSFLPPSKARPNSAKLAAKENFYMVHLPMEAQNYGAEEPNTLRVSSSQNEIYTRIKNIKKLFPKVKYINNHTGSKYTANETAVNKLIIALNKNNISFIDSRTTSETKVPIVMKKFDLKYIARDVFLDHHTDKAYIKKQIKEAIAIAKAEGMAIAIGHPHSNTILALYESKYLFKDVDLVFINKVY